jgi:NAD+ synthetase
MKVRVQQLNPTIGDIEGNTSLILNALQTAKKAEIDLLVLTEMIVCGYSPMDLLERPAFLKAIEEANQKIIAATKDTALIFGSITKNKQNKGRPCFNAALLGHKGKKVAEVHKTLLPTYDVFDEDRYFERNKIFECVKWKGQKLGITICEDIWANNSLVQYHTYAHNPVQELVKKGADVIINLSASPFTISKSKEREQMLKTHARNVQRPIFYANQAGGNTELISDGDSMVLDSNARIIARAPLFDPAFLDVSWDRESGVTAGKSTQVKKVLPKNERLFKAFSLGLKDYLKKTGAASDVLIGLSGGIDSSLVACIAVEALGAENVQGIAMPSEFSSEGSVADAEKLAGNLGIKLHSLPIKNIYEAYLNVLKPLFKETSFGVAEENIQSRVRGMLLMAVSNKFGGLVLNTGNKSELATGYCTLYGDMNGALAVISDLYKTEVFALAQWLNNVYYGEKIIPQAILDKSPSAELKPDQKDSDNLPEYNKLDTILKLYIEKQFSAKKIISEGFDEKLVAKIIQLVDKNEHKRFQAAPGLKVHSKSFGRGRRWPLTQQWVRNMMIYP